MLCIATVNIDNPSQEIGWEDNLLNDLCYFETGAVFN